MRLHPRRAVIALTLGATAGVVIAALGAEAASGLPERAVGGALAASRLLAAIGGVATAAAYVLVGEGRRHTALALIGIAGGLALSWLAWIASQAPSRPMLTLLESDREGLEEVTIDGERWVAHRTLGFRLPQPDVQLAPSEAIVRETAEAGGAAWAEAHQLWAFESEDRALTVTIDLSRAEEVDEEALERLLHAASVPLRGEDGARDVDTSGPTIERGGCGTASFGADLSSEGRVEGRLFAFEDPRSHRAFHLAITVVGPRGARADEYLRAIVVPCERSPSRAE